jgi:phosphomannomutase
MDPSIFRAYDIRGIYPKELNEQNIITVVKAIYEFFVQKIGSNKLTIVLGRDMRLSSPALQEATKKTLISLGATVIDIGLSSTPTVYFSVYKFKYDAGIQISASHNPKNWNGIKFLYRQGLKLIKVSRNTGMEDVKNIALKKLFTITENKGESIKKDVVKDEVDYAFKLVRPKINNFKVVADTANAMGSLYIEEIFKRTNCKLVKMNFKLDGNMPVHEANPIKFDTLKSLQKKILSEKADLGIATDGDGDRIFFLDEKAQIIPSTLISALIATEILSENSKEKILVDIRYTRNASKIVKKYGGIPIINMVGHALITETLNKENGAFSGESSGHYFFRETGGAESSARVIYYLLDMLSKYNKPLSEIIKSLMSSYESGEFNFKLPNDENNNVFLKKIEKDYQDGIVNWMDGLTVDYPKWRFNIRASNNEHLIRLNLEANSKELMEQKLSEVKSRILQLGGRPD